MDIKQNTHLHRQNNIEKSIYSCFLSSELFLVRSPVGVRMRDKKILAVLCSTHLFLVNFPSKTFPRNIQAFIFSLLYLYHFPYYQIMTFREWVQMERYKTVISTWHHSYILSTANLQNLNILISKIAIKEFYIWGNIVIFLMEQFIFSYGIKFPTETNKLSRASPAPFSSLS